MKDCGSVHRMGWSNCCDIGRRSEPLNSRTVLPDEIDEDPPKDGTYTRNGVAYCKHCGSASHGAETCRWSGPNFREELNQANARIAELEAQHAAQALTIAHYQEAALEANGSDEELSLKLLRAQEGERRKIEQCERLERAMSVMRCENLGLADTLQKELVENARLRREMGRKR